MYDVLGCVNLNEHYPFYSEFSQVFAMNDHIRIDTIVVAIILLPSWQWSNIDE